MTQIFFSWDFYSSDDTEFIRRLTAAAITHGFSRMRPVRSLQIPPEVGKSPTDFTDLHRFFLGRFLVTQISQMTQIFFSWDFYSSDDTEFIRRLTAAAITHGFSRMRPVRSLQIPPEVGKSPTDFTDLHRFFLGRFLVTQISQMTQIFFSWDFIHRMTRNLFGDFLLRRLLTDFRRCDLSGRYRYPLRLTKRFNRESIKNLCISVKSVGQNNPHEEKSASSAKSA